MLPEARDLTPRPAGLPLDSLSVTGCGPEGKMGPASRGKVQWVREEASS